MKTIIFQLALLVTLVSICNSQITQDYPFKTHLDPDTNLYVTGYERVGNTNDIYTAKFSPAPGAPPLWYRTFPNPFGDDRGLDLAVDEHGNTYITGYIFNNLTNSNDIIIIKYNSEGIYQWDKVYTNIGDDKGMGIDIIFDENGLAEEIFVTGYVTSLTTEKDFITKKFNKFGDSLWQDIRIFSNNDDEATDILVDDNFAYVVGYSYQGATNLNDITFITYNRDNSGSPEIVIHNLPFSNEKPTEFSLANFSDVPPPLSKSRSTVGGISDRLSHHQLYQDYITIFYDLDSNGKVDVRWSNKFNNGFLSRNNIATAVTVDDSNNVYVTGYTYNGENYFQGNGLDFATLKYKPKKGDYAWTSRVKYFNYSDTSSAGIDDRASSIKVNDSYDVFVAGMSDASPNGFSMVKYEQPHGQPIKIYDTPFNPSFIENSGRTIPMNKWATIHLASDGTPLLVVMAWDEDNAYWAARKYDVDGNVVYTIDPFQTENLSYETDNVSLENPYTFKLEQNYPNPFNPSTVIRYSLMENSFVKLIVYDALGKEVAVLVNQKQNAGSYNYQLSTVNYQLSSGVYFYKLIADGVVIDTKRMMLMK